MTVKAAAETKNQQGEPDSRHFERFCRNILGLLTSWEVDEELARRIGEDVISRAKASRRLTKGPGTCSCAIRGRGKRL
jgi:hypothetical protein